MKPSEEWERQGKAPILQMGKKRPGPGQAPSLTEEIEWVLESHPETSVTWPLPPTAFFEHQLYAQGTGQTDGGPES